MFLEYVRGTLKFLKVIDIMSAGWENKDSSVKISVCHKWKFIEALREDGKASLYTSKLAFSSPNSGLGAVSIKAFCPKMPLHHRLLLTWTLKIRCFNHEVLPWNSCTNQNCYFHSNISYLHNNISKCDANLGHSPQRASNWRPGKRLPIVEVSEFIDIQLT